LSIAIAQTQTEQASSPSITDFTTQCAWMNSAISETSEATSDSDCPSTCWALAAEAVARRQAIAMN
jgi:hypothetical protein